MVIGILFFQPLSLLKITHLFKIVQGLSPCQFINLVSLPIDYHPLDSTQAFTDHIHDLHAKIQQKIAFSNADYKLANDTHHRNRVQRG